MVFVFAATCIHAQPSGRVRESFNRGWLFERQSTGSGALGSFDRDTSAAARIEPKFKDAMQPGYDDSGWQRVSVPHTWNSFDVTDAIPGYWRGIGWYRKHFTLDARDSGKRVFLYFEGVGMVSEFWLNGERIGIHKGGYTSFELDITSHVRFGGSGNVLTVKVDNLYHAEIPPTVKTDYNFYGGIYRNVWLKITEPVYLAAVQWTTPSVSAGKAALQVTAGITNTTSTTQRLSVEHAIVDPAGKPVASMSGTAIIEPLASRHLNLTTELNDPKLWDPDTPNVYTIRSTIREGARVIDAIENPLGFRWFRFDPREGFFLNGRRVQIQGVNWHQSYPGMADALPDSRQWKDLRLIRDMGANFWRTSHYPHAPVTMDASDHLGLLVWEELPVNKEIGNPDEYIANVRQMAKEMIDRDRNHPSIVLWGVAGEVNAAHDIAKQVVANTVAAYRELDPTRPTAMHEPRGEDIEALVDVSGLGADKIADEKHSRFPQRCYMTSEYAAALIGRGMYGGGPLSEEVGCEKHEAALREINRRPWISGGCIWNAIDYDGETYDPVVPHMISFGMADKWRIPKEAYYFYQSQWSAKPMVHIVGHWMWNGQEGRTISVKVYSNVPEVELFLNGRSLGTKKDAPDDLKHPPRVWQVTYEPGSLRAVAHFGTKEVIDERKTAGPAYQVILKSDAKHLVSGDAESLAYLTATIADKDGTPVPDSHEAISFTSYGPGELLPQQSLEHGIGYTLNAIGGMARMAFRATPRSGEAVVSAYAAGLRLGRTSILVTAPGKPNEMDYIESKPY